MCSILYFGVVALSQVSVGAVRSLVAMQGETYLTIDAGMSLQDEIEESTYYYIQKEKLIPSS